MARVLTDQEIAVLLGEGKPLPANWQSRLEARPKMNFKYKQRDCELKGEAGDDFRIIIRESIINPLDFSIILTYTDDSGAEFVLVRYNGKHPSEHTNRYEKTRGLLNSSFRNKFHIHRATERYQEEGLKIDGYAEATEDYSSFETAMSAFVSSNGFSAPGDNEPSLFDLAGDS